MNNVSGFEEQGVQQNPQVFKTTTGRSQKLNSIHKQDKRLPGNFYYLKSHEEKLLDFHPDQQNQFIYSGRAAEFADGPDMAAQELVAGLDIRSRSSLAQQSSCSSEGVNLNPHLQKKEKSLIERYKTLEQLMRKKKLMAQVEAQHLTKRED